MFRSPSRKAVERESPVNEELKMWQASNCSRIQDLPAKFPIIDWMTASSLATFDLASFSSLRKARFSSAVR